jgi:formiminotetrahydrofolate cyclodeaminase
MDATRFDYYVRSLLLPRSSPAEKRVREKAVEHAVVRASSIPIDAAATILSIVVLALGELPAVEDVVFSDAVTGIRLLNVSAGCLLYIAEGNLRKIAHAAFASVLSEQLEALRSAIVQAESELMRVLDSRASNPSS